METSEQNNSKILQKSPVIKHSSILSSIITNTSDSKIISTNLSNKSINETYEKTSSLDLLSNIKLNNNLTNVLKSVTNQDDVFDQNTFFHNNNELDSVEPTQIIPSNRTDTLSNLNNEKCLEKYNGSRIYEYKDKESNISSIDVTKRKKIGVRIRYEHSSDWLINRCLICCMETSNDVRKYVQNYNNSFSNDRQIILIDGKLINENNQTFDEMNVKCDSKFEVIIKKEILLLIPKKNGNFQ